MIEYTIIQDTREQKPLFKNNAHTKAETGTLKTGDYSIKGHTDKISVERKSLADLFGTLGKGHARFKKELTRSLALEYFAIVVEGSYRDIRDKDFEGSDHTKMKGHVIIQILFTLHLKYGINFFMASDRNESKSIIKSLFEAYVKTI